MDLTGKLTEEQVDELKRAWAAVEVSGYKLVPEAPDPLEQVIQLLASQCQMLEEIRDELRQMNQGNEPDSDAEPDPYQTLNGPIRNPTEYL